MREVPQVLAQHAGAQRRADAVAAGDPFRSLVVQAEMAAAADQGVVVAGELGVDGHRCAQMRQRLLEAARGQQRQAMAGGVEAGE
jgi:hypothetical protein